MANTPYDIYHTTKWTNFLNLLETSQLLRTLLRTTKELPSLFLVVVRIGYVNNR